MARRATVFENLRQELGESRLLFLAGAFEFFSLKGQPPAPKTTRRLAEVYGLLNYDRGLLAPQDNEILKDSSAQVPAGFRTVQAIQTDYFQRNGKTIGIVLLPALPENATEPPDSLLEEAARTSAEAQKKAAVVVGISPWGLAGERLLLERSGQAFDILFGSGKGMGLIGKFSDHKRTLWIRAFGKGKAIHEVDILKWPEHKDTFQWIPGENITFTVTPLKDHIQPAPAVQSIFAN